MCDKQFKFRDNRRKTVGDAGAIFPGYFLLSFSEYFLLSREPARRKDRRTSYLASLLDGEQQKRPYCAACVLQKNNKAMIMIV